MMEEGLTIIMDWTVCPGSTMTTSPVASVLISCRCTGLWSASRGATDGF